MKNGYTKIFFSDPKSADLTSSKYKPSNNSEDHEEIKNVPHVFISFSCPLNATKRLETYVDFNILFADIRTVHYAKEKNHLTLLRILGLCLSRNHYSNKRFKYE